jgi:hypothetical protein
MRSHFVVIVGVASQNPTQMPLAKNDEMVDALAADRSDQPFGEGVLPGRSRRSWLVSYAHGAQPTRDDGAKHAIPIADQTARSLIPRESLGDLTRNPFRYRISCDIGPNKGSAVEAHDDESMALSH